MFHLALSVPLARLVRLAVAVLSTSLLAGCLEANATTAPADGGKESGGGRTGDSGRTGTPDTGKTGADATKSGHGDASSDSGGGASSCLHATATQTACGECAAGACKSSLSASETACPGFYACFAKCDCSDATCIGNCYTAAPATCQSSLGTFTSCQSSMCASACTPGDGGAVTDSGAHGDASADSCKNPTATELACGACDETMCKSDVTAAQAACASFYTCFAGCDCSSTSCIDGCAVAAPSSCQTALETLNSCQSSKCSSACSGSGKDAGGGVRDDPRLLESDEHRGQHVHGVLRVRHRVVRERRRGGGLGLYRILCVLRGDRLRQRADGLRRRHHGGVSDRRGRSRRLSEYELPPAVLGAVTPARRLAAPALVVIAAAACSSGQAGGEAVARAGSAIVNGTPATAYPEAVVVTASGIIPCSGVLLAPRVVLSAGHCRSTTKAYAVRAPNAGQQEATGSSDWTTFDGAAATSSDTLLIFLDSAIELPNYPTIAAGEAASGTQVVDVGRALNGTITSNVYASSTVTLDGNATPLGFPFNYQATPDISQDGDSGGPIELAGEPAHTVVAIVDTDTVEQGITETTPIDLFARLDVVRAEIVDQIAMHADAGAAPVDASRAANDGDAAVTHGDAGRPDATRDASERGDSVAEAVAASGSCRMGRGDRARGGSVVLLALALLAARRRRGCRPPVLV